MFGMNSDAKPASGFSGQPTPNRRVPSRPAPQAQAARRDPAPSRLAYRLHRLWLTPFVRRLTHVGLPLFLLLVTVGIWMSDETRRSDLSGWVNGMIEKVQNREEFMVHDMRIEGASPVVDKGLRAMLPVQLPASSFDIDLEALRARVLKLDAVESVELRIEPGGVLSAVVTERVPVVLWRHARGIELLDKTGHRVASATSREVRKDLPMIAGEGADKAAPEALLLLDAAGPILPRLRGLERIGERRWDLVLDRGQRILLPAEAPLAALERLIAIDKAEDVLGRDVVRVDMRAEGRPTVQIGLTAQNAIHRARGEPEIGPDGKPIDPEEKDKIAKDGTNSGGGTKAKAQAPAASAKTTPSAKAAPPAKKTAASGKKQNG
ncbi:cell division protein FtsQ/DivIB [Paracoccus aminophilus]|uniref:Cell division protein FtsQ n=1 Tax=Paracoccus aminophilus JCM 7686 TaxID=1367847 RepID=S5XRR1_PARAH|nr:cell division protein FtsQ/DivIB [Paracoccus aminophilus]AGT07797.1 cell division protein FtsQ [Paracoccus aminophilus JCM 7686]